MDNLAPDPPLGLAGEQSQSPEGLQLTWDPNTKDDLWYYAVYRDTSDTFTPGPGTLIATPTDEEWFDNGWDWEEDYRYKVSAVDENGNESDFALLGPNDVTGDVPPPVLLADFLNQNYPNPFNPIIRSPSG
jgi:fibronectin type 3 domain-containing protein